MSPSVLRERIETALSPKFDVSFTIRNKPVPLLFPSGIPRIDIPRGTLTEIYGAPSSGRTSSLLGVLARATRQQECCALIDGSDSFDPASGAEAGMDLSKLLWIRCKRNAEHALKAADLLVQAGGFGIVALDLAGIPARDTRRISLASWFRLRHRVEQSNAALLVVAEELTAKSCSTLQVELRRTEVQVVGSLFRGFDIQGNLGPRTRGVTGCGLSPVFHT